MYLILYFAMFIIGALLGSFFTLAVYRIPLKKDITHERSFCPNCNHRLEFLDLIPILSYIFLGGKCRYCKQKIRPRYLCLEILSGIVFLLFYISLKIDIFTLDINKYICLAFGIFYMSTLFIIAGIEKEKHFIPNSVLIFGLILQAIYIIYLYIIHSSIYKYVIYFVLMFAFILMNMTLQKKEKQQSYILQILSLIMFLLIATNEKLVIIGILTSLLLAIIEQMIKNKYTKDKELTIGFYLCTTNIILLIFQNFLIK